MSKLSTQTHLQIVNDARQIERRVFLDAAYHYREGKQRKGQALMNGLRSAASDLYEILSGTPEDPFFDDTKYGRALAILGFGEYATVLDKIEKTRH